MTIKIFDKIVKRVEEQEKIICPFCNAGYVKAYEYRRCVECPICQGSGYKAEQADQEVNDILTMAETFTIKEIESFILKLGSGFYRSEIRTYLNMIIKKEKSNG